jgi:hypothetical protein
MVNVAVSNRKGPAMKRRPSGATDRMALSPLTLRLRKVCPEATSYTNRVLLERPIIVVPSAEAIRPARNPWGSGAVVVLDKPAGGTAGGEIASRVSCWVAGSRRIRPALPRITTRPSLPTAMAAGCASKEIVPATELVARLITVSV